MNRSLIALALAALVLMGSLGWWLASSADGPRATEPRSNGSLGSALEEARLEVQERDGAEAPTGDLVPPTPDSERVASEISAAAARSDEYLTGLVLDPFGAPLAGATVRVSTPAKNDYSVLDIVYGRDSHPVGETLSDDDGRFRLAVPTHRRLELSVTEGRHARAVLGSVYGGEDVVVRMELGAVLEGRVTRASDGQPLDGIRVRGWARDPAIVHLFDQPTDRGGNYRFDGLPAGTLTLALEPEELAKPGWATIELEPGLVVRRDYALEAGIAVAGRVTDALTGEPIANAEVGPGWTLRTSVRSDSDGRYVLRGVGGSGVSDVHARAAGYGRTNHDFDVNQLPTEDVQLDFALQPARGAIGRVVGPDDVPRANVYVGGVGVSGTSGEWEGTRTAADGSFRLASLVPLARHQLFVQARGFGTLVIDFPPDEASRTTVDFGTLRLPRAAQVVGRVVDDEGSARPGVSVQLEGRHEGAGRFHPGGIPTLSHHCTRERETFADGSARFHFTDLAPGTYSVVASVPRGQQKARLEVTLAEGQVAEDLELVLPVGLAIRGQVVTSDGDPCAGVWVSARPESGGQGVSAVTRAEGNFEFVGLTEGSFRIHARPIFHNSSHPDATLGERALSVAAGTEDLRIELARNALVRGIVRTEEGGVAVDVFVLARSSSEGERLAAERVDEQGRFELIVPVGELVDLETRTAQGAEFLEQDWRSVVRTGVSPGDEGIVLTLGVD